MVERHPDRLVKTSGTVLVVTFLRATVVSSVKEGKAFSQSS